HLDQQFILHGPDNQQKKVKVSPTVMGTNIHMLAQLASQSCGIALLPESAAQDFVKSGQLLPILPEWKAPHGVFHAVYPSRRGLLPAVRVFIDYLVENLSER
ncbi:MAG TPA: LysR family transcriptional regulator, partial [Acinetobacter sp.]|nr:LysR family transcriptional regulator [Acinetobacter sp.]